MPPNDIKVISGSMSILAEPFIWAIEVAVSKYAQTRLHTSSVLTPPL